MDAKYVERFNKHYRVHAGSGCWNWIGLRDRNGYGLLFVGPNRTSPKEKSHRVSWRIHVGDIPKGCILHHLCHNKSCVNPAHLMMTTRAKHFREHPEHNSEINRTKTHCIRGHAFDAENTAIRNGKRSCRACERMHQNTYYQLRKGD